MEQLVKGNVLYDDEYMTVIKKVPSVSCDNVAKYFPSHHIFQPQAIPKNLLDISILAKSIDCLERLSDQVKKYEMIKEVVGVVHNELSVSLCKTLASTYNEKYSSPNSTSHSSIFSIRASKSVPLLKTSKSISLISLSITCTTIASLKSFFYTNGFPIVGRGKNCSPVKIKQGGGTSGTFLATKKLEFNHPFIRQQDGTRKRLEFEVDLPAKFDNIFTRELNSYSKKVEERLDRLRQHGIGEENAQKLSKDLSQNLDFLLGQKDFGGVALEVNHSVFVPRRSTMSLVNTCVGLLKPLNNEKSFIIDIGSGSGNISILLAKKLPKANILGIDISEEAILLSNANAQTEGVSNNCTFLRCDVFSNEFLEKTERFENGLITAVVCNPPYLSSRKLDQYIKVSESPEKAVLGGKTGLDFYTKLSKLFSSVSFKQRLSEECTFILEVPGNDLKFCEEVKSRFISAGLKFRGVGEKDLYGMIRCMAFSLT